MGNNATGPDNPPEVILIQPEATGAVILPPGADSRFSPAVRRLKMAAKASWIVGLSCMCLLPGYTFLVWPHYIVRGILVIGVFALAAVGVAVVTGIGSIFVAPRRWIVMHSGIGLALGVLAVVAALLCGALLQAGEAWQAAQRQWLQRGELSFAEFLRGKMRAILAERKAREEMTMLISVPAPGFTAAQVEQLVADPIEHEARKLEDFESIQHISKPGECKFRLEFKAGGNHSVQPVLVRIMESLQKIEGRQNQWFCSAKCSKPSEVPTDWEAALSDPDWPSQNHDNADAP